MAFTFVDAKTRQAQTRRDVAPYVAPLPRAVRPSSVAPAKSGTVVADFGYYNGQTSSHYTHVLLSREVRNNAEIVKRYANMAQKAITRYRKDDKASKSLAVYARKGNARLLIGVCDVYAGNKIVWHDVTVTGAIVSDGAKLDGVTDKLHVRTIKRYVTSHTPKRMHAFINGLTFYSEKVR